ncbi:MAG TPA: collagen-binding domain-containing protein, partial [Polyangiaceae bacterium]
MKSRVVGLGLLVCATACNRADRKPESTRSVEERVTSGPCAFTAPPTGGSVTNVTFAVKTPAGVLPSDLALGTALGSLKQRNGVKLVKDAGGFASVASVEASARLAIGTDAQAQSAYSELTGIDVGARAHLFGSVRTANTLTRGPNVLIDGTISQNSNLKPLEILAWNAAFPSLNRGSCDLQPDKTQIIDPGTYGNIVVKARSHLKLRAGTYYFTSLSLEATAILDVDNGAGPVFINVKNAFAWSGAVVETQPTKGNVVFALATNGPVNVMTALRGLVVAPNATLTLSTSTGHYGSFFARTLEVRPNATIHHRPLSSAAVCPGATDCNALCPCPAGGICRSDAECQSGLTCEPGTAGVEVCTPVNIDDGNPCTIDSFAGGSVVHTPVPAGTSCSDGNACNGAETCNASGSCVAGAPVVCVASDQCHDAGACAPATGLCENPEKPNGAACSDADACTASDTCQAGSCTSGAPVAIDDGNPCTTDACDPATGVIHAAVAAGTSCADGDACNGAETCSASANCLGGTPPVVDDGNPCTADACDPSSGVSHTAVAAGASCADGDACNGAETCNGAGSCAAGTPPGVDDGNPCTADACDSASGVAHTPLPGTSCETDGDVCNGVSVCDVTGACVAGPPPDFNDGNACTSDSCDPASGPVHTAVAAGSSCSNGDACDGDEACDGSGDCLPGTPLVLDDGDPCTRDVCDPLDGISHAPEPAGTSCEDGNLCTSDDACDAEGFCASGPPVLLEDDGDPCTLRYCHPETGVHTVTCPPVDAASVTTLDKSFEFLYTGPDAPQTGVEPGTIEPLRAAVVSGRVLDLAGTGISGAAVSVVGAPELGVSTTLPDGTFYLAVNGGESLVIDVAADGYLRAQRRVEPKWGGFDAAPEIALVGLDPEVTAIEVDAPVYQVARGSTSVDADGTRRATVMFPPGTTATMTLPDGSVVPLDDVEVRATEFTVGARGDEAMPGELPPSSGYTYAAELSVDAALVAGATRVDFNQDLPFYLENFLNIPNGTSVPAGYYDRELGQWVPSDNGRVIRIVSAFNGTANVDADGNGSPDTDAPLAHG